MYIAILSVVAILAAFLAVRLALPRTDGRVSVRRLVRCAVIAAVYVVLCLVLAPFSYGAVQVRIAEALCLLPVAQKHNTLFGVLRKNCLSQL